MLSNCVNLIVVFAENSNLQVVVCFIDFYVATWIIIRLAD